MFNNVRPVSFAILSGALMLVGSSMAFANPDQTSPRDANVVSHCDDLSSTRTKSCDTVQQTTPVTADASTGMTTETRIAPDHDARKDRSREHNN
jgi:hypothetical protein